MATNRLDLGRVRGDDGANGHPAVVEVLEETATSYVLGITYYDDGGVEHVIQTPNLKGADGSATFTVSSDADLRKWMDAEAGNDYTCVLVKPAAYTLSGTVDLVAAGTEAVMGFGASLPQVTLRGSGSEMVIGLAARACTDVLLVAADGSVRCSNLRGELLTASAADALAAPATAADYGKVRYGQAGTGDSEIAGVTPAKLRAGIRAPYNPGFPSLNVIYVQGDGDDYILNGSVKISTSGFNVPSVIKRVLASEYDGGLRLHILTTDGRLFYAAEQSGALNYAELVDGLPSEPLTDIAYNPLDTDWSSVAPFPAMLTAAKFYSTPTQSDNHGGVECYYMGKNSQAYLLHLVRDQNGHIKAFEEFAYDTTISEETLPADAVLYPAPQSLLVKTSSFVKVVKYIDQPSGSMVSSRWSDYAVDVPTASGYTPQVRFSPDVFPDGFSASALFDDMIIGRFLKHVSSAYGPSGDFPLFMTTPHMLDGKLMSLVIVSRTGYLFGDCYAKLVVWEGYEDFDSVAGAVLNLTVDQSTQSVTSLICAVFKDGKTYQTAPAITGFTYKETSEHKVGIGFVEKQEVDGVMEYKAGDGAVFLTKEGVQEAAANARGASVSEVIAHNSGCNRWLRFDPNNRKGLVIKGGTSVSAEINGVKVSHTFEQDTTFDLTSAFEGYDDGNITRGQTFAVYLADIGQQSPTMLIRLLSEQAPADGVLLGWFSTLCSSVSDFTALVPIPSGYTKSSFVLKPYSADTDPDFVILYAASIISTSSASEAPDHVGMALVGHPLSDYNDGDILPESVWCRDFHPACVSIKGNLFTSCPDAMVFDAATGKAVDVYGMHKNPETGVAGVMQLTSSRYQADNHISLRPLTDANYDVCKVSMLTVGKSLMTRADFYSASIGTPQHAAIPASRVDELNMGGYSVDNEDAHPNRGASGRLISFIGCESMCGVIEQWLDGDIWVAGTNTAAVNGIDASLGTAGDASKRVLLAAGGRAEPGAMWNAACGSLAVRVYAATAPLISTARGVCRVISGTRGQA